MRVQREDSRASSRWAPHPKVATGAAAGNLVVILLWLAGLSGLGLPPEVAAAFAGLVILAVGYFTPER